MRTALALLCLLSASVLAQVRSDYQTVKAFEQRIKQLSAAVDSANTIQECADVRVSLEQLQFEFGDDKELLNKALYGENYEQRINRVSGQLALAEKKIGVIESQIARIVELETQVRDLSEKVAGLTTENSRLLGDVERLSENIRGLSASNIETSNMVDSLKGVIGRLQKGLRERDEMIFALVDSLFLQYDKDLASVTDDQMQGIAIKLDRNNVVSGVITSIENNIRFLEQAELSGAELSTIIDQHARFSSQWKGIGPKLASIYVRKKNRAKELAGIDTLLARWSARADEAQWRELNRTFSVVDLPVGEFSSGQTFVQSLTVFIDGQLSSDASSTDRDSTWARFERVWNADLSPAWIPLLVRRENITQAEADTLTAKVDAWRSEMTPTSPFVYALIFIVIVSLLALAYSRYIKNKPVGS